MKFHTSPVQTSQETHSQETHAIQYSERPSKETGSSTNDKTRRTADVTQFECSLYPHIPKHPIKPVQLPTRNRLVIPGLTLTSSIFIIGMAIDEFLQYSNKSLHNEQRNRLATDPNQIKEWIKWAHKHTFIFMASNTLHNPTPYSTPWSSLANTNHISWCIGE